MERVSHEYYVSPELAELLREVGFDWSSFGYYNKLGFFHRAIPQHDELKAPTLDVAQRWLREVKNIDIDIHSLVGMLHVKVYVPYISIYRPYIITESDKHFGITEEEAKEKNWLIQTQFALTFDNEKYSELPAHKYFYSYEEAQEAGIRKALEIILKKGK